MLFSSSRMSTPILDLTTEYIEISNDSEKEDDKQTNKSEESDDEVIIIDNPQKEDTRNVSVECQTEEEGTPSQIFESYEEVHFTDDEDASVVTNIVDYEQVIMHKQLASV